MKETPSAMSSDAVSDVDDGDIDMSHPFIESEDPIPKIIDAQIGTPEPLGSKRWEIKNFSQLGPMKIRSDKFSAGDSQWKIVLFPKGDGTDHLSLYLEPVNAKSSLFVHFQLTVVNQIAHHISVVQGISDRVDAQRCLGFKCFMPLDYLLDPTRDFLVDDILIVKAEVYKCKEVDDSGEQEEVNSGNIKKDNGSVRIKDEGRGIYGRLKYTGYLGILNLEAKDYDKEKSTSYLGIKNQGFTCYMNSVIQTLYHIPFFRKAVYKIPTTKDDIPSESTPLALQRLFYMLQFGKSCATTTELAASFGKRWKSFMMQDVFEFCKFLSSELQEKMKGTVAQGTMDELFQVRYLDITECLNVDYKSTKPDESYELTLPVKGRPGVYASFDKIVGPELLDGKYDAGTQHGEQDAQRITKFTHFPPVLQLQLERFSREYANGNTQKINDYYEFPSELDLDRGDGKYLSSEANRNIQNRYVLHSVLAHVGDVTTGHYYAYIRPTLSDEWYKFNDETVTKEDARRAIEDQFGGDDKGRVKANAYMLVYIRESDKDKIMCSVDKEDIPEHLKERFLEESRPRNLARQIEYDDIIRDVSFKSLAKPPYEFTLPLATCLSYDAVVGRVAEHLCVEDHTRIQLTSHNTSSEKPNPEPIQPDTVANLLHMLRHNNKISDILYYKLDIPLHSTENQKTLRIEFQPPGIINEVCTHTITMPKSSNVGDLFDNLRTKINLPSLGELRLYEVFGHKIYKVFSPEEKIADLNDQYMTLRAEEISEEEKNLGPEDRMIRVYHYADATQVKVFGCPFFLVIHKEEKFADIKPRLQKKAKVSDTVFAKWNFAFLGLSNPEYLQDSDVLYRYFKPLEKDTSVAWQPFLGIHHPTDSSMDVD